MINAIRNLAVSIMAAFIRDRDARHQFRNRYKKKSKFTQLKDENILLFNQNKTIYAELLRLNNDLSGLRDKYNSEIRELKEEWSILFRVAPLDNITPPPPTQMPESDVFLAIACISKNEGQYIKEWIEYHKLVGVQRFYFYDNESSDNTKEILEPYVNNGTVVYHFLPNHPITRQAPQIEAYNDAIYRYRDITRWMAIIDIDEFIVPVEKDTVTEFLLDFDQYPAVAVNWVCFDSNGHDHKPTQYGGLVTANYTRVRKDHNTNRIPMDRTIKSIINPKQVINYISCHYGIYYLNFKAVTENFVRTNNSTTKLHSVNKIRINHYRCKSKEEYIDKLKRNSKGITIDYRFDDSQINYKEETCSDLVIQKYVPRLKRVMGINN